MPRDWHRGDGMTTPIFPARVKSRRGKRRSANRPRLRPRQLKSELSAEARDWLEFCKLLREARFASKRQTVQ